MLRRTFAWGLAMALGMAPEVVAFNGAEHARVSNAALRLALNDSIDVPVMFRVVAERLLKPGDHTFGDYTRAADWFQDPMHDARSWQEIDRRRGHWLWRGLAAHNNEAHFQKGAVQAYAEYHSAALERASTDLDDALRLEAIALHYLQDFFSPGHVVTPRAGTQDPVAAGMHDAFNTVGILVVDSAGNTIRFKGDGWLGGTQEQILVEISRVSILDLMRAVTQNGTSATMKLCFRSRSALEGAAGRPKSGTWRGPYASLQFAEGESGSCKCDDNVILRYEFETVGMLRARAYPAGLGIFDLSVYGSPSQNVRDLGDVMLTFDPSGYTRKRQAGDETDCGNETFPPLAGFAASLHFTVESSGLAFPPSSRSTISTGVHLEVTASRRPLTLAFYAGERRYRIDADHEFRPYGGVKAMMGIEVINVIIVIEKSGVVTGQGRLVPRYLVRPGIELVYPGSWLKLNDVFAWAWGRIHRTPTDR